MEMPSGMEPVFGPNGPHQVASDGVWRWRDAAGEVGAFPIRVQDLPEPEVGLTAAMQRALEENRLATERAMTEMMARMFREFQDRGTPPHIPAVAVPVETAFTPTTEGNGYRQKTKAAEPPRFDGTKREEAEDFIESCVIYQTLRASEFQTDHTKILFAVGYLEGSARQWARKFIGAPARTWKEFSDELLHYFGMGNRRLEMETDLVHLRQGQTSFDTYMNAFNALAARLPDVDEYSRRMIFQANLLPSWKSAIMEMEVDKDMSVGDFQEKCYKYAHKVTAPSKYSSGGGPPRPAPPAARTYPQGPVVVCHEPDYSQRQRKTKHEHESRI